MERFLDGLSPNALLSLPWLFEHWALEGHQVAPEGPWDRWLILGGRGAGKTRAGAEWVRTQVEGGTAEAPGRSRRVALVGETLDQARDIMVHGPSGILAVTPPDRRPDWQATQRRLVWPNGTEARIYSASDPETLRGPQFDAAWCDELAKWKRGADCWDMLQFALRLGDRPQVVVTTTPRRGPLLRDLLGQEGTVVTSAPTAANRANLAPGFVERVAAQYAGTWQGRQELEGELLPEWEGALWEPGLIDATRSTEVPPLDRIVVAVDPAVSCGKAADLCGMVVCGAVTDGPVQDWRAYLLEDASVGGLSPQGWASRAVGLFHKWKADRIVAEVNQGGDLVAAVIGQVDPLVPVRAVRAQRGKVLRAEPVAALYEQGRVVHAGRFDALEDELCALTPQGYQGSGSPDRADALVWALTDLMIDPAARQVRPRLRSL
ncbi:ATP-binding protein [Rhodobacteraceae bacterium KN286]|uniref:ATP-binding protein n=1 Tax=Oceanomicrobium pacificus TaxID=2692916 RepID=A0A6B0TNY1_9RHOB|nr:terminase family protein [Oceanomicrobium pacificus]MXU66310.1 ATP-binding protein [Oceanomicrobium pacificus]